MKSLTLFAVVMMVLVGQVFAQQTATQSITITFLPPCTINTTPPPPNGLTGKPYTFTFATSNCVGPLTWAVASGSTLPSGLTLNASTGVLSGTGPAAGSYTFTIQVTDSTKLVANLKLNIVPVIKGTTVTTAWLIGSDGSVDKNTTPPSTAKAAQTTIK